MLEEVPIIVVGLGFGDEGKGTTIDYLTRVHHKTMVVRFNGGPQAGHNVVLPSGQHHRFSQFGSGTFVPGVMTYLSKYVLIDPFEMMEEEKALQKLGIDDAFTRMCIDTDCQVILDFHIILNRFKEEQRGANKHGSCGMGFGEAVEDGMENPSLVLRVGDLLDKDWIYDRLLQTGDRINEKVMQFSDGKNGIAANTGDMLLATDMLYQFGKRISIVMARGRENILRGQSLIFEGAQGILLDQDYGFHPHTTWSKCTSANAFRILEDANIKEAPRVWGVTRTFSTRHGNGPFPSECTRYAKLIEKDHNKTNDWQGVFKAGWMDLVLLNYAILSDDRINGIVLTHVDSMLGADGPWIISDEHKYSHLLKPARTLDGQIMLRQILENNRSVIRSINPKDVRGTIEDSLERSVILQSAGNTFEHKFEHLWRNTNVTHS